MMIFSTVPLHTGTENKMGEVDENCIGKIADGSKEAFSELYRKMAGSVYAYAMSILGNRESAEDVMQETFLKIRSSAHLYSAQGKPEAWILRIARNICFMKIRSRDKAAISMSADADGNQIEDIDFRDIEDSEDRIILEAAFSALNKQERTIIVLHAVAGLKHREISELCNIPLSTVLSKYSRGLKKMRKAIKGRI